MELGQRFHDNRNEWQVELSDMSSDLGVGVAWV